MPQCCPQQLDPNLAPNPTISTHLVVPLWLSLCQTLCSLQHQLWQLNPDPTPKNITPSINLVSLLPTLWMVLPVTLWMMTVMIFSLFLMYVALFWRSQILLWGIHRCWDSRRSWAFLSMQHHLLPILGHGKTVPHLHHLVQMITLGTLLMQCVMQRVGILDHGLGVITVEEILQKRMKI